MANPAFGASELGGGGGTRPLNIGDSEKGFDASFHDGPTTRSRASTIGGACKCYQGCMRRFARAPRTFRAAGVFPPF
jgi:hypothetical protein